ncbi:HNH endonuclease signature motif containing protein [Arthrobacter sp. CAN_A1]|uniref:HNH endonuclease signature motif containing protein n=1 Tax=Arthrobacter sp. CAN_A1 TaxID=2787717 RepID=UPI0018CA125C
MAITEFEQHPDTAGHLAWLDAELAGVAGSFGAESLLMPTRELAAITVAIEQVARTAEQLQLIAAHAVEHQNVAVVGESDQRLILAGNGNGDGSSDKGALNRTGCRDNAEYLRNTLRVSKSEAKRRIRLSGQVLASVQLNGQPVAPRLGYLGAAVARSEVSSLAATLISAALDRVRPFATGDQVEAMEANLTRQAAESDVDVLRVVIKRWEDLLNPDGNEPSEEVLRARQGVFLRGKRHGLHFIEISATDEQYEDLVTVMQVATNPRTRAGLTAAEAEQLSASGTGNPRDINGSAVSDAHACSATRDHPAVRAHPTVRDQSAADGPGMSSGVDSGVDLGGGLGVDVDRSTWAQQLLDGLVGACRVALAGGKLSDVGGLRPQVLVTIDYKDLVAEVGRAGTAAFGGLLGARSIRRIACDAEVLPVVLGTKGQILEVGKPRRLFPPSMRKALTARDGGCAFPDCMMPLPWTEAHHIIPWSRGGPTTTDNGVLLCIRHHHLLHQEEWTIQVKDRVPWFVPPPYIDPAQRPRQNYFHRNRTPLR